MSLCTSKMRCSVPGCNATEGLNQVGEDILCDWCWLAKQDATKVMVEEFLEQELMYSGVEAEQEVAV